MTGSSSPRIYTLFLLAALALAGCFPSSTEWVREGASSDDLRVAQRDCERTSGDYSFIETSRMNDDVGAPRGNFPRASGSIAGDSYRSCMEAQGWRRQRANQPAAK